MQPHATKEPFSLARALFAPVRWVVEKVLVLYYVSTDPKVSLWAKRCLAGALLYVFSLGLILDFLPPIGEVDDFIAFLVAAGAVAFSIKPHHVQQAKARARNLFRRQPPMPSPPTAPLTPALPPPPAKIPPVLPPPPSSTS